jgi:hypothetical protein|tara:strand:- start:2969 stop:3190 length:222 start_codon:yes stop_codon:yes gene_type:complete
MIMWQDILKDKGVLSHLAARKKIARLLGKKPKKPEEEKSWFDTVKEAGAISTATPGFIPRPRYRKRKHDEDIK